MQELSPVVDETLSKIRDLYRVHFDRSWLDSALRETPMESQDIADIRHALSIAQPTVWDLPMLHRGINALEIYVRLIRQMVLPRAKQLFNASYHGRVSDLSLDESIRYRMLTYTLPSNLERLIKLTRDLKQQLPVVSL